MRNMKEVVEYIGSYIEYMDIGDKFSLCIYKSMIESRPTGVYVQPEVYFQWLEEDVEIGRLKERAEVQKKLAEQQRQEELDAGTEDVGRKKFEELRNIERDSKGRLNKGALLAKKESCNESKIYLMYAAGATVKEIVAYYGCSKSVVYRVLAKHKQ